MRQSWSLCYSAHCYYGLLPSVPNDSTSTTRYIRGTSTVPPVGRYRFTGRGGHLELKWDSCFEFEENNYCLPSLSVSSDMLCNWYQTHIAVPSGYTLGTNVQGTSRYDIIQQDRQGLGGGGLEQHAAEPRWSYS